MKQLYFYNGEAYVILRAIPVSYFFDGNCIFAQSREGKKIDLLRKNPKV